MSEPQLDPRYIRAPKGISFGPSPKGTLFDPRLAEAERVLGETQRNPFRPDPDQWEDDNDFIRWLRSEHFPVVEVLEANKKRHGGMKGYVGESKTLEALTDEAREFLFSKKRTLCDPRRLDDIFNDALPCILHGFEMPKGKEISTISRTTLVKIDSQYEHNSLIYNANLCYGSRSEIFDGKNNIVRYLKFTLANNDYVYADLDEIEIPSLKPSQPSIRHLHYHNRVNWEEIQEFNCEKNMPTIRKFQRDFFGDYIQPEMYYNCKHERVDLCFTADINEAGDKLQLTFCFENQYPEMIQPGKFAKLLRRPAEFPPE
eukprot:m.1641637 g.1641637  ORF g.1641637 m.1641637 type:complete len:315 (-) comp48814_c0_seq1:246-1190(-)